MGNLHSVKIPLLERVVLEELALRAKLTTDQMVIQLIRQAAVEEMLGDMVDHGEKHQSKKVPPRPAPGGIGQ